MSSKRRSRRPAMSLIEVLAAAMVFGLAVLVVFATFNLTLRLNQFAREDSIAANVAEETIESYRAKSFDSIIVDGTSTLTATTRLPAGWVVATATNYQSNGKIKQVEIQVYWRNRPQSRAIILTTLKSAGGIGN